MSRSFLQQRKINLCVPPCTELAVGDLPTQIDVGDTASVGVSDKAARSDHQHALPAPGNPETVTGATNNPGISTNVARQDHQHRLEVIIQDAGVNIGSRPILNFINAIVADDIPNDRVNITITPLTANVPTQIDVGDTGSAGVSNEIARADHQHALPAPGNPETVTGATNSPGISTNVARQDHQHRLEVIVQQTAINVGARPILNFTGAIVTDDGGNDRINIDIPTLTANVPTQIDVGDAGQVGVSTEIARSDHQHALPAPGNPETVIGSTNSPGVSTNVARQDHQHRLEVTVQSAALNIGFRPILNFTGGAVVTDDGGNDRVDIDIPSLTASAPTQIDVGDAGLVGVSTEVARADHQHALPAPGNPETVTGSTNDPGISTNVARQDHQHRLEVIVEQNSVVTGSRPILNFTGGAIVTDDGGNDRVDIDIPSLTANVPTQIDVGDAGLVGVSTEIARADHQHALPAPGNPVTVVGATNSPGVSTNVARQDHQHRLELIVQQSAAPIGSRPILNFTGGAIVTDDGGNDRVDVSIPALTASVPTQIDVGDAGLVGVSTEIARADHQHALPAPGNPATVTGATNSPGTSTNVARQDHQHRLEVTTQQNAVAVGSRPILNFTGGAIVTDNAGNDRIDISIPALTASAPTQIDVGDASLVGVSTEIARADHQHALPAPGNPITVVGATNSPGVSTNVARQDHQHRLEVLVQNNAVNTGSRPTLNFTGGAIVADDVGNDRVNISVPALTATTPTQIDVGDAGVVGVSTEIARADHQHALPAPGNPVTVTGTTNSPGASTNVARQDHQHRLAMTVQQNAAVIGSRPALNFTGGATVTDNAGNDRIDIAIPALTASTPTQIDVGDAGVVGVSTEIARADHQHALPAPAAPANVNKSAASAGVSTNVARQDHKHDIDTATPITVVGSTNSEGTATTLARSDHQHRLQLGVQSSGVAIGSRPNINFTGATVTDNAGNDRVDIAIPPLTSSNPTQIDVGDAASVGVSTESARADHQHALPAPAAPSTATGATNIAGVSTNVARQDHVHRIEVNVQQAGVAASSRPTLNFTGATVTDNVGLDRADIVIPTVFATATPLAVTASGTVALSGVEAVLMSGNITIPSGSTGRIFINFGGTVSLGSFLIGTNGAQVRLRVGGVVVTSSTRSMQYTATLAVSLTLDSQEMSTATVVTGLVAGVTLIEVLVVKLGGVSTASITGNRELNAFSI